MSKDDFETRRPEQDHPENPEANVDFSDLGPLFAPQEETEAVPCQEDITEESLQEETAEAPCQEESLEETRIFQIPEAETVEFEPQPSFEAEETVSFEPDNASASTVDFSDLGPLFSEHPQVPEVQAGEAALLLKKLSELPPEEEIPVEETPLEDTSAEVDQDLISEEVPAEDPIEETAEEPAEFSEEIPAAVLLADNVQKEISEEENPPALEEASEIISEEPDTPLTQAENLPQPEEEDLTEEHILEDSDEEEAPVKKEVPYQRPQRKGRPKRKKGEGFFGIPNLLVTVVWIAITVLIGVTLGRMAWLCAADVLAFGRDAKPVTITVYEADTIDDITKKLHEGGLIQYPGLFKFYASLAVDEGEIHPGIWDLNTRYDYHALVNMMSPTSSREIIELMIPEGYSCRQIFALMEENKICTSLDLGAYAASGELGDYWFLEGVPRGDMYCLEGYLFPDTYQFYKNDSPRAVLTKMLDNFQHRFDEAMVSQIDPLNTHLEELMRRGGHGDQFIAENKFTVQDVINVASLIEKETSSADEGYVIASVIYNRLFNWPGNVPYLNIDATIVYALGGKNKLTQEDLKVNSPYNTYTHTGLTPGPIANPGLASIQAALDPADTNYYFYVLDPALGSHRFSTTYDEHKATIASIGD